VYAEKSSVVAVAASRQARYTVVVGTSGEPGSVVSRQAMPVPLTASEATQYAPVSPRSADGQRARR
jgi:hypothetical protein